MISEKQARCLFSIARALGIIEGIALGLPDDYRGNRLEAAAATIDMRLADILDETSVADWMTPATEQPEV